MSDLPGLIALAANNTVSVVELQPEALAVLLYALGKIDNYKSWLDFRGEYISDADIELIHELVDLAADNIMRPIVLMPIGTVIMYTSNTIPDGWLLCNGASYFRTDYPELSLVLPNGGAWGGSASQLQVPNFNGRSPLQPTLSTVDNIGKIAGSATVTLNESQVPAHTHPFERRVTAGAGATFAALGGAFTLATDGVTKSTGGGGSHDNIHPVLGVNFIILARRV